MSDTNTILLGEQVNGGKQVLMPLRDFMTHGIITGTTGAGKTVSMRSMILQIWARCRGSVVLVEPTANLINDLLQSAPPMLFKNIHIIDVAGRFPTQLNFGGANNHDLHVQQWTSKLRQLQPANWDDNIRMTGIIKHAINLIVDVEKRPSMVHLANWIDDAGYRLYTLNKASDRVQESIQAAQKMNDKWADSRDEGESVLEVPRRRLNDLLTIKSLLYSVGMPPVIDQVGMQLERILARPQQLVLLRFKEQEMGEAVRRVVGMLTIDAVVRICKSRNKETAKKLPTVVFLDEFRNVADGGDIERYIKVMLAETRQFGLGVMMGYQFPKQLASISATVKDEIAANANLKYVMGLETIADAKLATDGFSSPVDPQKIVSMKPYTAYIQRRVNGQKQPVQYVAAVHPDVFDFFAKKVDASAVVHTPTDKEMTAYHALKFFHSLSDDAAKIDYLHGLKSGEFNTLASHQYVINQRKREMYYVQSQSETDPRKRADLVRRMNAMNSLHHIWCEAQYRRLRFGKLSQNNIEQDTNDPDLDADM